MLKLTITIDSIDYDRALGVLYDEGITSFVEDELVEGEQLPEIANESLKRQFTVYYSDRYQARRVEAQVRLAFSSFSRVVIELQEQEDDDWETRWKKNWKPERIFAGLVICPGWQEYVARPDERVLYIDTTSSFGTGGHESTRLALKLMAQAVKNNPHKASLGSLLDIGCGSGVLAVYGGMVGFSPVLGIDIDDTAVENAGQNARRNGLPEIDFKVESAINAPKRFDFVVANMISSQLLENWSGIAQSVVPHGTLLLSGLLAAEVGDFCKELGLIPTAREVEGEWEAVLIEDFNGGAAERAA